MIPSLLHQEIYQRKSFSKQKQKPAFSQPDMNSRGLISASGHKKKNAFWHRLYIILEDRSILEWTAAVCTGIFLILALAGYCYTCFAKERFQLDIRFPRDSDLEMELYEHLVPVYEKEEKTYHPHPDAVETLKITDYTVKKGETVSEIALAFRLNVDTIISYNNIKSVRKLYPGMNLRIPNTEGITYKVKKGDCLSGIAGKFGISLDDLLDWNNITSSVINPGLVLFIPGVKMNKFDRARVMGTLFIYPAYGRVSSPYGWRDHPISKKRHFHNGVDIANSPGTVIKAAMDGRVIKTGYSHIYGKYIIIRHGNGFQTLYGHLRKIIAGKGTTVVQGNKIGEMGNTGYSTGTHLHFSIYKNGETVDPLLYLKK
jgi:LysM repeat protein